MNGIEQIAEEWKVDLVIDQHDITGEMSRTPHLHQKYLDVLIAYKFKVKKLEQAVAKKRRDIGDHFSGRSEKPSPLRVLKGEVPSYIDADDGFQEIDLKLESARLCVLYLEKIVSMIEKRSWDLKTMMEWHRFTSGR